MQLDPILILGGAPRIMIDAIRYTCVAASGQTALRLREMFDSSNTASDLLLSQDVHVPEGVQAQRYTTRTELDQHIQAWVQLYPRGLIVSSAAINDYEFDELSIADQEGHWHSCDQAAKAPSGGQGLRITLRPAPKMIDQLPEWGHRGRLVAFKYQSAETVRAAALRLQQRVGASLVVVNSLCGQVQEILDDTGEVHCYASRTELESALAARIVALVTLSAE